VLLAFSQPLSRACAALNDVSPPAAVDRMTRVQRPPIQSDIGAETVQFDEPLRAVMAALTERLKRPEPEFVDVAVMWLDVIADRRWRDDGALQAVFTKRAFEQLVFPDPGPPSR
jgi:hypothetical protein